LVNLVDRELKFFFTSPLFISLELAPAALVAYMLYHFKFFASLLPVSLLSVMWVIIVLYSTFFELEIWRRDFLNKGIRLKIYTNTSEYTPFLVHSLISLILLELKTLIILTALRPSISDPQPLIHFLIATHGCWLFSLAIGYILSKEVLRKLAGSTAIFLCVLILGVMTFMFKPSTIQSENQFSSSIFLDAFYKEQNRSLLILVVLLISLLLYILALYACSVALRNTRIDDI
jgi:hypothetical protein